MLPNVIKPMLVSNGGPVAMVQIENEFGSYGHTGSNSSDHAYMEHLKNKTYALLGGQAAVQLYTTDGGDTSYMQGGTLPGEVFATGDWGPDTNIPGYWAAEDTFNPPGMRQHHNSEYYTGWLTHWGETMANTSTIGTVGGVAAILAYNGSFNLYMAYGGTNWGFWNGANGGGTSFQPVITSYDYDSPISEGGIHGYGPDGDKYAALQQLLGYWQAILDPSVTLPAEPPAPSVTAYGTVTMTQASPLFANLDYLSIGGGSINGQASVNTMEAYNQSHGYIVYRIALPGGFGGQGDVSLSISGLADRGQVFMSCDTWNSANCISAGVTYRPDSGAGQYQLPQASVFKGAVLDILVENCGHINYGHGFFDPKGITGGNPVLSVQSTQAPLAGDWTVFPIPMQYNTTDIPAGYAGGAVSNLPWQAYTPGAWGANGNSTPSFYRGVLTIATGYTTDTYITLCGWTKGTVWINGHHIGRYWETQGPQHSLYVPAAMLLVGANEVIVFEQHTTNAAATVAFVDVPDFTGAVCASASATTTASADAAIAMDLAVTKSAAAASVALASVPSGPGACTKPAAGVVLSIQDCGNTAATTWTFIPVGNASLSAGALQLSVTTVSPLCVGTSGTNPSTGNPAVALVACAADQDSPSSIAQHWMHFDTTLPAAAPIMSLGSIPGAGMCFDVTGGAKTPGTQIELYGCSGNSNQGWDWTTGDSLSGQLKSRASGLCLAAC